MFGIGGGVLGILARGVPSLARETVGAITEIVRDIIPDGDDKSAVSPEAQQLSEHLQKANQAGPRNALEEMHAEDLTSLMEKLSAFLASNGIDIGEGLQLSFDQEGNLLVDHPQSEEIAAWLEENPAVVETLQRALATGSLLETARQLDTLRTQAQSNPYAAAKLRTHKIQPVPTALQLDAEGLQVVPQRAARDTATRMSA